MLSNRPIIRTASRKQMAEMLVDSYRADRVSYSRSDAPFLGIANRAELPAITLHYCRFSSPFAIQFADMPGYQQFFCLSGFGRLRSAGRTVELTPHTSVITQTGQAFEVEYSDDYAHLVLQVDEQRLKRRFELMSGGDGPLPIPILEAIPAIAVARVKSLALTLAKHLPETNDADDLISTELAEVVVGGFLSENQKHASGRRDVGAKRAPRVGSDRLEEFIKAHWDRALTVEDVAQACGVGVRSLFNRFSDEFGMTPLAYMRGVRLDQARRLLSHKDNQLSVLDIALKCGFSSFGHFASRYRERFGELPSETISRG